MSSKRELIELNESDKHYIRRDEDVQFTELVDQGKSLSQDAQQDARNTSKPGHGDQGDGHTGDESRT